MTGSQSYEETLKRLEVFAQQLHLLRLDPPYQWAAKIRAQLKADLLTVVADHKYRQERAKDMTVDTVAVGICACGHDEDCHMYDVKLERPTVCTVLDCPCQGYEWVINVYVPVRNST